MNTASRVSDIREAFEAWVTERSRKELWPKNPLERRSDLNYSAIATHYAWKAWKAAIACQGPVVPIRRDVYEFLLGAAPLNGMWFGESSEIGRPYWWRHALTAIIAKANGHE